MHTLFPSLCKRPALSLMFVLSISLGMLMLLQLFPLIALSQKKLLVASNKVNKIGYIESSRVRTAYTGYTNVMDKYIVRYKQEQHSYQAALLAFNQEMAAKLLLDSVKGGKQHEAILTEGILKQRELEKQYKEITHRLNKERTILLQTCEKRITEAVREVIAENGLTDVQLLPKDSAVRKAIDLTDLILKKLN